MGLQTVSPVQRALTYSVPFSEGPLLEVRLYLYVSTQMDELANFVLLHRFVFELTQNLLRDVEGDHMISWEGSKFKKIIEDIVYMNICWIKISPISAIFVLQKKFVKKISPM